MILQWKKKKPIAVCKKLTWAIDFSGFSARWASTASPLMLVPVTVRGFGVLGSLVLEYKERNKKKKELLGMEFPLLGFQLDSPLQVRGEGGVGGSVSSDARESWHAWSAKYDKPLWGLFANMKNIQCRFYPY